MLADVMLLMLLAYNVKRGTLCDGLTHGGREDNNPQYVHALAGTGDDFILDVWSWSDLQEDWVAQLRVVVVGHDIHIVGLRVFFVDVLYNGYQVRSVLELDEPQRFVNMCTFWS